jgi:hypothetical protein
LSAVDAHVGRHIFDNVIGPKGLLKAKTRIFVTHSIQFLPESNHVIMLQDGAVAESGSYKNLMDHRGATYNLMKEYGKRKNESSESLDDVNAVQAGIDGKPKGVASVLEAEKAMSRSNSKDAISEKAGADTKQQQQGGKKAGGSSALMTVEQSAKGSVAWSVYAAYAKSCGTASVVAYLLVAVISQFVSISQNLYLADWADANDRHNERSIKGLLLPDEVSHYTWRIN